MKYTPGDNVIWDYEGRQVPAVVSHWNKARTSVIIKLVDPAGDLISRIVSPEKIRFPYESEKFPQSDIHAGEVF